MCEILKNRTYSIVSKRPNKWNQNDHLSNWKPPLSVLRHMPIDKGHISSLISLWGRSATILCHKQDCHLLLPLMPFNRVLTIMLMSMVTNIVTTVTTWMIKTITAMITTLTTIMIMVMTMIIMMITMMGVACCLPCPWQTAFWWMAWSLAELLWSVNLKYRIPLRLYSLSH